MIFQAPSVLNVVVTTSNSALDRAIEVCKSKSLPTYHKPTTPSNRVQYTAHGRVHTDTHTHTPPHARRCADRDTRLYTDSAGGLAGCAWHDRSCIIAHSTFDASRRSAHIDR